MAFHSHEGLKYFTFEGLSSVGVSHGIFTRHGGVSPEPWASLNLGGTTGDSRNNVVENRKRMFGAVNRPVESNFDAWQVHGVEILFAESPRPNGAPHTPADILLTNRMGITLMMRFADCVPILLVDPRNRAIGLVHAGWQGTVLQAAKIAVEAMKVRYGSDPEDLLAGIGPSIGPDHYEVGEDVLRRVRESFGVEGDSLVQPVNGKQHLDLWKANGLVLNQAGVRQVEVAEICTACHINDWYSHRLEHGKTGRFGALIGLE